ncbi:hypothetical protein KDN32_18115 [Nocardioides sp. J2M5]|uniref:hypothetical protein n=1 Tax=Nocardioides palaemonis TaxID=2829810 RepID=UPI001BA9D6F7|nr:hypothetical protein [Nocardioides palaemonis]MBS2939659.1 hypothetical protein [Nocardioides palaemonis]
MDPSREVMESSRPPRPPRPFDPSEQPSDDRRSKALLLVIALAAVAAATFTGIGAWEQHRERVNNEVIYCTLVFDNGTGSGDQRSPETAGERALADQLNC